MAIFSALYACGGGGGSGGGSPSAGSVTQGSVILKPPVLGFTDTGFSVSDGVTRTGLWSVTDSNGLGWEFSLDLGKTWVRGDGVGFEVMGDGQKTIWVRARDDFGNTSEIVVVQCTLDTMSPASIGAVAAGRDSVSQLTLQGIERDAQWEFSPDDGRSWVRGTGATLSITGNALAALQLRQVDLAGNPSSMISVDVRGQSAGWVEPSNSPMQPTALGAINHSMLVHGSIVSGDMDFVSLDIPAGHRLRSASFVYYESSDRVSFFAMQRKSVFDAGVDTAKMMAYGHFGPEDLGRNLLASVAPSDLGPGALTIWINQTGAVPTRYGLLVTIEPMQ